MHTDRAPTYRRRRLVIFSALTAAFIALTYFPLTLLAPVGSTTAVLSEYAAPIVAESELVWPSNAATAIGAVGFPGVLASTGSSEPRSIASITKVVTALVVLEAHPLAHGEAGPTITFGAADARFYHDYISVGGAVKPVRVGLSMSQREVMQVMLISSANNYAKSLAVWAFGSESAFLSAAQDWLTTHGLTSTRIFEPTGMDPHNVSTVTDLLELGKLAVSDPTVSEIVAMSEVTLPYVGTLESSNRLLGTLGIDGIKTGTLNAAGACLLFSADFAVGEQTVTVVGVALGGVNHKTQFPQVRDLMESVAADFHEIEVVRLDDVLATYRSSWGAEAQAVASRGYSQLVWGQPEISVEVTPTAVMLAEAGSSVGNARFTINGNTVDVPLKLSGSIADPGPGWRLENPFSFAG